MNKRMIFSLAIMSAMIFCLTDRKTSDITVKSSDYVEDNVVTYVDPETGVNYRAGGMTVSLNADGTPYVTEVQE